MASSSKFDASASASSSSSAVAIDNHLSVLASLDSSRSHPRHPSPILNDPTSSSIAIVEKPIYPIDIPSSPLSSPVISLRNLRERSVGVRIADQIPPASEISEDYSSNASIAGESELKWEFDDGLGISHVGISPSLPSSTRLRGCDVYIGLPSNKGSLLRFAKWLRAELELQGVSCFATDRSQCKDAVGHNIVERAMNSATFGVVIITKKSFSNAYSINELRNFLGKKNLVPIYFGLNPRECLVRDIVDKRGEVWEKHGGDLWKSYGGTEKDWKDTINGLSRTDGCKLEAHSDNWRDCISKAILLLGMRLGRRSVIHRVANWKRRVDREEFPLARNDHFIGRKRELLELELMLFGGNHEFFELKTSHRKKNLVESRRSKGNMVVEKEVEEQQQKSKSKGKEPVMQEDSEEEIKMDGYENSQKHYQLQRYGMGIACVSGEQGIGKTELLLEFAYRFARRYRMVLWVGGESKYIRQNYMNLLPFLEVNVDIENQFCFERNRPRTFEELEEEAIRRVRKELMRDIPYLIVIDNLEDEKDWWDSRNIKELLPRFGGQTHVLISTRLPKIMNMKSLRLSYLSGMEAMSLMKEDLKDLPTLETNALQDIEEELGRLPFGLALVRGILSKLQIDPHELLDAINKMPSKDLTWNSGGDELFRRNPFLRQLIDFSFAILDNTDRMASKIALASAWFAPTSIPVSLLALASLEAQEERRKGDLWKKFLAVVTCRSIMSQTQRSEEELSTMLVQIGLARSTTKRGYIHFHEIIKLYARKKGTTGIAHAMFSAINIKGSFPQHIEHIWAACFLLFKFGTDPVIVEPKVSELVSFIKRLVLPLAIYTFTNYSRCNAAVVLLRSSTDALEAVEKYFLSQVDKELAKSLCWGTTGSSPILSNPLLYQDVALLIATLLETRAKLMLHGGKYDIGVQLCVKAQSVREVFYGKDHPETISASNTKDTLLKFQAY